MDKFCEKTECNQVEGSTHHCASKSEMKLGILDVPV